MENSDGMNKREAFNVSIEYEHGDVLVARLNEALKSVKTNVTSFGESTNPSWSTMNPNSVINSDVEQNIWSSSVPTGLNASNTSAKGIFTSFGESTNPSLLMNVLAELFEAKDVVPVPT
ncbi:hypothetical protein Tco_1086183 [Tanacetum coccineum]